MGASVADQENGLTDFAMEAAQAAAVLKSLSNEARLLVLCHLSEASELSAGELTRRVGLSQSALSQHLAKLRAEGIVTFRRDSQTLWYRIADPRIEELFATLHRLFCRPEKGRKR